MYSPKINESLVRRLYRVRKAQQRPMTHVVADALETYLAQLEGPLSVTALADHSTDTYAVTDSGRDYVRRHRRAA